MDNPPPKNDSTQLLSPQGIVAPDSDVSRVTGAIDFFAAKEVSRKKSESETKELVELAKSIDAHLKLLNRGDYCGSWQFNGLADSRYSSPSGDWAGAAYRFEKDGRRLNIAVQWTAINALMAGENRPYIAIESENRNMQTANYDFVRYSSIDKGVLNVKDNYKMSRSRLGAVKKSTLLRLYEMVNWNEPHVIGAYKIAGINLSSLIGDFLNWGEKRDKVKEIITKNPNGFLDSPDNGSVSPNIEAEEGVESVEELANVTKIQSDAPNEYDLLNRRPFAIYLSKRLGKLWKQLNSDQASRSGKSFVIHLYSEWGSGKTTFLNLLKSELKADDFNGGGNWIVVDFNAWQNQHIEPAWWPLMDGIISESISQFEYSSGHDYSTRGWLWWREWLRRFKSARSLEVAAAVIFIILGVFLLHEPSNDFSGYLESIGGVIALTGSLFMLVFGFFKSLLSSTARSAELYQRFSKDPLGRIKSHFNEFLDELNRPVMVFIDDLDRCREPYVVSLLESLHTLFNDRRVFYVVAADRRWVSACFHNSYQSIASQMHDANRPTGYMFTEKLFQLSIGLPSISSSTKNNYVSILLGSDSASKDIKIDDDVKNVIASATNFSDFSGVDASAPAVLSYVLDKTLDDSFDADLKHRLESYVSYLLPNPRFIKLLINTYGINVAVALSSLGVLQDVDYEHIAIWSIISLRYPMAALELSENTDMVQHFLDLSHQSDVDVTFGAGIDLVRHDEIFKKLLEGGPFSIGPINKRIINALTGKNS